MRPRRTFDSGRHRSMALLANQPRRLRPKPKPKPSWSTPACEAKRTVSCRACGYIPPTGEIELHHAVPRSLSRAGRSDPRNIIGLCHRCHIDLWHSGTPLPREIFTSEEWAFIEEIAPSIGWLGRRYPPQRTAA